MLIIMSVWDWKNGCVYFSVGMVTVLSWFFVTMNSWPDASSVYWRRLFSSGVWMIIMFMQRRITPNYLWYNGSSIYLEQSIFRCSTLATVTVQVLCTLLWCFVTCVSIFCVNGKSLDLNITCYVDSVSVTEFNAINSDLYRHVHTYSSML